MIKYSFLFLLMTICFSLEASDNRKTINKSKDRIIDMHFLLFQNLDSVNKRLCYDDTILTKLSLTDDIDSNQSANLRRVQTIRVPSSQRKTVRLTIPTFIPPSNENDDEVNLSFFLNSTTFPYFRLVHFFQLKTV
jgi:hypothetical protein